MKRVLGLIAACALVLIAATAWAQTTDIKIGYVDFSRIQSESKAGVKAMKTIESMFKDKQSQLDQRQAELEKAMKELEKQAPLLAEDVRKQKEDKLQKDYKDLQRFKQDSEDELNKKKNDLAATMFKEVNDIIKKYGKQEGYTLILERSVVLYAPEAVDVTDKIIKMYDESKGD
jgi:outer membrane protein